MFSSLLKTEIETKTWTDITEKVKAVCIFSILETLFSKIWEKEQHCLSLHINAKSKFKKFKHCLAAYMIIFHNLKWRLKWSMNGNEMRNAWHILRRSFVCWHGTFIPNVIEIGQRVI